MASRRRRNLRPAMAVGSLLLLAGAVGGYMVWPSGPAKPETRPVALQSPTTEAQTQSKPELPAETGASEVKPEKVASHQPEHRPVVNVPPAVAMTPAPEPAKPAAEEPPAPLAVAPAVGPRVVEDYPADLQGLIRAADQKLSDKDPVTARELLNRALHSDKATDEDRQSLRIRIARLNDELVFSPTIFVNDPMTEVYTVQSGDSLTRIVPRQGLAVETGFVARVNRMSNPNSLRLGQKLKLVRGPFHAVVTKSAFRMDVFAGNPGEESDWMYIRSFTVGLGEGDSTPTGDFVVRRHSKLINPPWINPRTREQFGADDPKNPIGERWVGLEGVGASAAYSGYGIHGTIDPESVGQMKSMGCVRLAGGDVEVVYDMLVEAVSTVRIDP